MKLGNGRPKQERDSLAIICRNSIKANKLLATGGTTGTASLAEQLSQTALLTAIDTKVSKGDLKLLLDEATDLVQTFVYLDAGLADERVSTITYTSPVDFPTVTVTKTFVYDGSAGAYRVSTITLS